MNACVKRVLVIAGLVLSPVGCAVGGSTEPATVEAQEAVSAGGVGATADAMSACYDDYNCKGSVIERGRTLKSCNNMDEASSWRASNGKCFNL